MPPTAATATAEYAASSSMPPAAQGGAAPEVVRLRAALRDRASARGAAEERTVRLAVQAASEPLLDRLFLPLLRYCRSLVTSGVPGGGPHRPLFDADDLALEAWHRTLRYLDGPGGDRVENDLHLWNLLRCAAANRLVDRLREHSDELANEVSLTADLSNGGASGAEAAVEAGPERHALLWGADHRGWHLVEMLFRQEERFHVRFRTVSQRHPRQYRALVLYELGAWLHREATAPGATAAGRRHLLGLMRRHADLFGIAEEVWVRIEEAAVSPKGDAEPQDGLLPGLRDAVNDLCGTAIRSRATLSVLRHDLNKILSSPQARGMEWK